VRQHKAAATDSPLHLDDRVEGLNAIVWEADARTAQFTYINRYAEVLLGYPIAHWLDAPEFWPTHLHPEDRDWAVALRRTATEQGQDHDFEYRFISASGRVVWLRDIVRVVTDEGGRATSLRGVMVDITEHKSAEGARGAVLDVASDMSGTFDLRQILDRVHCKTAGLLPCDRVATYYREPGGAEFRRLAAFGLPAAVALDALVNEVRPSRRTVEWVMDGNTVVINDIHNQTWLPASLMEQIGVRALVGVPLFARGRMMGVLAAARDASGSDFTPREVRLLEDIAQQVALTVSTVELYRAQEAEAQVSAALARAGRELIVALDRPALLEQMCRLTAQLLDCDVSHTLFWDPSERVYAVAAGYGDIPEHWEAIRVLKIPHAVVAKLIRRLEQDDLVQLTATDTEDLLPSGLMSQYGFSQGMYVALRRGSELIGVHTAGRRKPTRFTLPQERVLRGLAQLASLAIEHVRVVEELERANRLKYDFVATMSHELRTPLNVIMGYSDLLLEGEFGALAHAQLDILRRIDASAQQLLELINATLDLSRLDAGKFPLERTEVPLADVIQALDAETRELQQKPGLAVTWHVAARLPPLHTDPLKLKVVLKNLVTNAIKFTDHGSVSVRAARRAGGVEIAVADTGIGIPREVQALIFEPFRQAESAMTRRYGGVGLGLYIARRLVDLLGGTITVESASGAGATFRVWLPAAQSARAS